MVYILRPVINGHVTFEVLDNLAGEPLPEYRGKPIKTWWCAACNATLTTRVCQACRTRRAIEACNGRVLD